MPETPTGSDDETRVVPPDAGASAADVAVSTGATRYQLLEPLGRGGGGVVYAAHDRELDRRVAIKLLRASSGGSSGHSDSQPRLVREAQAMARLAHPNVIPVYDVAPYEAGELTLTWPELAEEDEVPAERGVFVVMELVEGNTLSEWLQQSRRPWRAVLDVMVPAGRGLAAAHAQGLVHRDFKPGNVLVGDDGRPRVLDFGLARATEQPWSESGSATESGSEPATLTTPLTQTGTVLGTPVYMAPEQHRGEPASEAADQFSYCVVLYEALCGQRPFRGTNIRELRRQKEAERLPAPPQDVHIPRWLWAVVERGLRTDPAARFPSMQDLLHALDVAPRARRRRFAVGGIAAVVVAAAGFGVLGWLGRGAGMCGDRAVELDPLWNDAIATQLTEAFAATNKPYAAAVATAATAAISDYAERWTQLRQRVCEQTHVERSQPTDVMSWRDACLDGARSGLQDLLGQFTQADAQTVQHAVEAVSGLPSVERCASPEIAAAELARGEQEMSRMTQLEGKLARTRSLLTMAKYVDAEALAKEVLEEGERTDALGVIARARIELGRIAIGTGDAKVAEEQLHAGLTAAEEAGDEETATRAGVHLTRVIGVLAERHAEADRMADQVAARMRRRGREDELAAEFQRTVGSVREKQGKYQEALEAFERCYILRTKLFAEGAPEIAQALGAMGLALFRLGEYEKADGKLQQAVAMYRATLGDAHPYVGKMMNRIAVSAAGRGRLRVAIGAQREALRILEAALKPGHQDVINATSNLAVMLHQAGDDEEALIANEKALAFEAETNGKKHPQYGIKLGNLALVLRALDRREEAVKALREQLVVFEVAYPNGHVNVGYPHLNLASVLGDLDRNEEALAHGEQALAIWEKELGPKHDMTVSALTTVAQTEQQLGNNVRARELSERALELYESLGDFEDLPMFGRIALTLAHALPASERKRSRELAHQAREAFAKAGNEHDLEEAEKWMTDRGIELPPLDIKKPLE